MGHRGGFQRIYIFYSKITERPALPRAPGVRGRHVSDGGSSGRGEKGPMKRPSESDAKNCEPLGDKPSKGGESEREESRKEREE